MGIYIDHGVVYIIGKDVIINTKETDDRLEQSNYFKSRRDTWFKPTNNYNLPIKIIDPSFDVQLTNEEYVKIQDLLKQDKDEIEHGWYEIYSMSSTY